MTARGDSRHRNTFGAGGMILACLFLLTACHRSALLREVEIPENAAKVSLQRKQLRLVKRVGFRTGRMPKSVCFTPDGARLLVACLDGGGLEVFDLAKGEKRKVDIKGGGIEVACHAARGEVWVSQMTTAKVYIVSLEDLTVTGELETEGRWSKVIAFSPDGGTAYVSNWVSNDISVIDVASRRLLERFKVGEAPRGILFVPGGENVLVANFVGGDLVEIDARRHAVVRRFPKLGGGMRHIVSHGDRAYISNLRQDAVYVFDLKEKLFLQRTTVGPQPNTIALSPAGDYLFVSCRDDRGEWGGSWRHRGLIQVLRTSDMKIVEEVEAGPGPTGLALSADGRHLANTNIWGNTVDVYEVIYDAAKREEKGR